MATTSKNFVGKTVETFVTDALTTGDSAIFTLEGEYAVVSAYVTWSAGVSAGAVRLYTAPSAAYAGTWAPFGPQSTFLTDETEFLQMSGEGVKAVKVTVDTNVVGGTVTVTIVATQR